MLINSDINKNIDELHYDWWKDNINRRFNKKHKITKLFISFMEDFKKLLNGIYDSTYNDLMKEFDNMDDDFLTIEYSDGGGCGTTAPLLECGKIFKDLEKISNKNFNIKVINNH